MAMAEAAAGMPNFNIRTISTSAMLTLITSEIRALEPVAGIFNRSEW
jgi:hypothetical protein